MGFLDEKVALVTGGGSGIGLASVRRLAGEGALVAVVDIDQRAGSAGAAEVGGIFVAGDVASPTDWTGIAGTLRHEADGIDLVHLNAGVMSREDDVTRLSDEEYRRVISINLDGVVFGVRAAVPLMEKRGGGAIVVTASLASLIAFSPDPLYTLTKHAVVGLVRALEEQLRPKHITINAVCPGLTDTPLLSMDTKSRLNAAGFPLIPPERVADAVLARMVGSESGTAWVCQAGRDAIAYEYRRVPGPRMADGSSVVAVPTLGPLDTASSQR